MATKYPGHMGGHNLIFVTSFFVENSSMTRYLASFPPQCLPTICYMRLVQLNAEYLSCNINRGG